MLKSFLFLFCIFSLGISGIAQDSIKKFRIDLSIRERFELWNGMNAKNYGNEGTDAIGKLNDKILYQRIILGATYQPVKGLTIAFHMQDSRAFGWSLRNNIYPDLFKNHPPDTLNPYYTMNPNEEFFMIYDAFIEYQKLFKYFTVKLGRQKLFYGDYRIFGPGDWGNSGRWTWDALKISYTNNGNFIDLFAGGTKINDPEKITIPFTQTEFWGGGLYTHWNLFKYINAEPFYIYKTKGSAGYINEQHFSRSWLGLRLVNNDLHHFVYDFLYTHEFGRENGKNINAYGYFAKIGYQFHFIPLKPLLSIRESYASGGKKSDAENHTFDPAYGAQDKFYGWMNITTWSNLNDPEIVLELFPVKRMWIEIKYNWFFIPVPDDVVLLNTMKLEPGTHHLGNELDVFTRYDITSHWQLTGAFGWFQPGDLKPINSQPAKAATWFALQVLFIL